MINQLQFLDLLILLAKIVDAFYQFSYLITLKVLLRLFISKLIWL
jgi:hypothetical protein